MFEIPWSHSTWIYFTALPSLYYVGGLSLFDFYAPVIVKITLAEYIKGKTRCALDLYGNSNYFLLLLQTSGGIIEKPTHRAKGL